MKELVNLVDFRGSDGRLLDGSVCEGSRQTVPYPAVVWDWKCVQSYAWATDQHINVLELVAFLNYYKCMSAFKYNHNLRFFQVLDSRVVSCVVSKGRSSSKVLNMILRRLAALLISIDAYALPLWTISAWNFADAGSRVLAPSTFTPNDG